MARLVNCKKLKKVQSSSTPMLTKVFQAGFFACLSKKELFFEVSSPT